MLAPRVRFAPSPTGLLHIGGLRTALYNYLYARKHGGTFVLRIEDTDQGRYEEDAERDIAESMRWAGLTWDEGPDTGGAYGPYRQSERKVRYRAFAERLVEAGHAYYAFDTPDELDAMRERLTAEGNPAPRYDAASRLQMKNSLTLPEAEWKQWLDDGVDHVIRLNVPSDEAVTFEDAVRGTVTFRTAEVDDQVLVKSDGMPTYHLANVVDDHEMKITHVIRGEEWLPSTPKHVLLYQFFGWTAPAWAHLPLILSPTGGKLSKRQAEKAGIPVSVQQYREAGYEPEALINFLAFLGWNPGTEQEVFDLATMAEAFSLDRINASGVQFDLDKLRWFNEQHLRAKPVADLANAARPLLQKAGFDPDQSTLETVSGLLQERISFLHELPTQAAFFFKDPTAYDEKTAKKRWKADSPALLRAWADRVRDLSDWNADALKAALEAIIDEQGIGFGKVALPLRLAVTGEGGGPDLFPALEVIGRDATLRRVETAMERLK